jgi:hypothetical protein
MSNKDDEQTQPLPEQQSAEDTSPWEDKPATAPDGGKYIRTDGEEQSE